MIWRWVEMRAGDEKWQSIKDGDKEIAIVVPGFPPIGDERIARLIAAAPALLDALREAHTIISDLSGRGVDHPTARRIYDLIEATR